MKSPFDLPVDDELLRHFRTMDRQNRFMKEMARPKRDFDRMSLPTTLALDPQNEIVATVPHIAYPQNDEIITQWSESKKEIGMNKRVRFILH